MRPLEPAAIHKQTNACCAREVEWFREIAWRNDCAGGETMFTLPAMSTTPDLQTIIYSMVGRLPDWLVVHSF